MNTTGHTERSAMTIEERLGRGKAERKKIGWAGVGAPPPTDRDPRKILAEQNESRVASLVPLRAERMGANPFAFYRGTAAIMAADLACTPHSGILVASCGDAHVSNFGFYASPQRSLVFDLNDFDEAATAPWEWDVKRLVTSIVIAGQATSRDALIVERAATHAVAAYLSVLRKAIRMSPTDRYFAHFDVHQRAQKMDRQSRIALEGAIADALKRTGKRAVKKLTAKGDNGRRSFVERPPVTTPLDDAAAAQLVSGLDRFVRTASEDIRLLLAHYRIVDVARRVVGVGSVGTRCFVVLLDDGNGHHLILQVKEAGPSVLERYGGIAQPSVLRELITASGEGARVVGLQRVLQSLSDPFLGHFTEGTRSFYVRQFHDMKGGIDMDTLDDGPFDRYAIACGTLLARAHAQSPVAAEIVGFAGKGAKLSDAIVSWALAYARLSRADHQSFVAQRSG